MDTQLELPDSFPKESGACETRLHGDIQGSSQKKRLKRGWLRSKHICGFSDNIKDVLANHKLPLTSAIVTYIMCIYSAPCKNNMKFVLNTASQKKTVCMQPNQSNNYLFLLPLTFLPLFFSLSLFLSFSGACHNHCPEANL